MTTCIVKELLTPRFYGPGFGAHPVGLQSPGCLYTVSQTIVKRKKF